MLNTFATDAVATANTISPTSSDPAILTAFTVFPKLPVEIRYMIFEEALLHNASHLIAVEASFIRPVDPEIAPYIDYRIKDEQLKNKEWQDARGLSLLTTCKESRGVYLDNFKQFLPVGNGKIYFSDEAQILVTNYLQMEFSFKIVPSAKTQALKQIRTQLGPMKQDILSVWCDTAQDGRLDSIPNVKAIFVVLVSQVFTALLQATDMETCLGSNVLGGCKRGIRDFENSLKTQDVYGEEYELSNTFYMQKLQDGDTEGGGDVGQDTMAAQLNVEED